MEKKVVAILVILALVLSLVSLAYTMLSPFHEVKLITPKTEIKSSGQGKVGVVIDSPQIETKNG